MSENSQTQRWVGSARQGDLLALSKLLATYHPTLRKRVEARMDRTLKAKFDPEDVLQEVYLEVFRRIDRFEDRGPGSFLNWITTILDNKLVDAWRALHRRIRDIAREMSPDAPGGSGSYWNLLDQVCADSGTPSRAVRHEEAIGALLACVSGLPDLHRRVIQGRFIEGNTVSEVAGRLGKSDDAVVALTRHALNSLRASMDQLGEFTRGQ